MIDKLIERIEKLNNPTAVGLDTNFDYLPDNMKKGCKTLADASKAITEFNFTLIDRLKSLVPAVKVQVAYYEMYGVDGMRAFSDTLTYAKKNGLVTIADCKRNDIGSTAACYSSAYLGRVKVGEREFAPFESDFLTVNGYLGTDGLDPFIVDCRKYDKGIFVLVKTSNPTQAEAVRKEFENLFFLIPGYGAQGGSADGLTVCFDSHGRGGIVNNSRGIICAYKKDKFSGMNFAQAAENAVIEMREDIYGALKRAGKAR